MVTNSSVVANSWRASSPAPAAISAMSVVKYALAVLRRLYVHTHMQIDQKANLLLAP
jgi:hypothetical protein